MRFRELKAKIKVSFVVLVDEVLKTASLGKSFSELLQCLIIFLQESFQESIKVFCSVSREKIERAS